MVLLLQAIRLTASSIALRSKGGKASIVSGGYFNSSYPFPTKLAFRGFRPPMTSRWLTYSHSATESQYLLS